MGATSIFTGYGYGVASAAMLGTAPINWGTTLVSVNFASVPAEEPSEQLVGEPIIGWRVWQLVELGALAERSGWRGMFQLLDDAQRSGRSALEYGGQFALGPIAVTGGPGSAAWMPRARAEARCDDYRSDHTPAVAACVCGLWAFKELETLRRRFEGASRYDQKRWVCGTVALWGRIVVCKEGYRAQYAYPQELELVTPDPKRDASVAADLSALYGVPCVAVPEWGSGRREELVDIARLANLRPGPAFHALIKNLLPPSV